mmetsp:Transcript_11106/g.36829  ORF Transcript_11106/g.36829 Transcript_11106/m.36829 type:complete len:218 (-) Transcript_11106:1257-1910(-)
MWEAPRQLQVPESGGDLALDRLAGLAEGRLEVDTGGGAGGGPGVLGPQTARLLPVACVRARLLHLHQPVHLHLDAPLPPCPRRHHPRRLHVESSLGRQRESKHHIVPRLLQARVLPQPAAPEHHVHPPPTPAARRAPRGRPVAPHRYRGRAARPEKCLRPREAGGGCLFWGGWVGHADAAAELPCRLERLPRRGDTEGCLEGSESVQVAVSCDARRC